MTTERREMTVGATMVAVLVGVLALSYGSRNMASTTDTGSYELNATFNRVDGLFEGDDVRLSGIKVGTVGTMTLDPYFRAKVRLHLDSSVELPTDSSAAIHTSGLFGAKYVVLEPGGEDALYKTGDDITFTQDATIVSELMELIIAEGRARQAAASDQEKGQ